MADVTAHKMVHLAKLKPVLKLSVVVVVIVINVSVIKGLMEGAGQGLDS